MSPSIQGILTACTPGPFLGSSRVYLGFIWAPSGFYLGSPTYRRPGFPASGLGALPRGRRCGSGVVLTLRAFLRFWVVSGAPLVPPTGLFEVLCCVGPPDRDRWSLQRDFLRFWVVSVNGFLNFRRKPLQPVKTRPA